ncbi:Hpt domain-containing protein [Roseateles sp. BYS87W]|uniref:Hpt domain-containing protein n=1 Tax=Pelomonas baiyunensis TaxID=3299026 RepID=A0ABW7GT67_9BURK
MNPPGVIDEQVFAELQDSAGADFVAELVGSFLDDAPALLAALAAAAAYGDADAFRRCAHTVKSNAHTFGATALADAARALEHTPLTDLGADAGPRVAALRGLYDAAAAVLQGRRHA